jgi:hypothetical protein
MMNNGRRNTQWKQISREKGKHVKILEDEDSQDKDPDTRDVFVPLTANFVS